jgi:putative sterol carrier protein
VTEPMDLANVEISAADFAALVRGADDDAILSGIRAAGVGAVLARIFQGMVEQFLPEKAAGVSAVIQWVVTDQGAEHPFVLEVADGRAAWRAGRAEAPTLTFTTDLVSFVRLLAGQQTGPALFMNGKLRISGDLLFAQRVQTFFRTP